jgi:acetyl-CoA carboxylase carboxyltransferase component
VKPEETNPKAHAELERRSAIALAMGGMEKLAMRKEAGLLNARERVEYLFDAGSFQESGLLGESSTRPEDRGRTPADGKVTGFGRIAGREAGVVANDFTVKGASSSATNAKKTGHIKRVAKQQGFPVVLLGESTGARMPDHMGSRGMGTLLGQDGAQYLRTRETPWASATLGHSYGSSSWYSVLSDFNVMRKGAVMAVSSPLLASLAVGEDVDPQELGGWKMHSDITGFADRVVDTDEQAIDDIRAFLSYLPSHHGEPPPESSVAPGSGDGMTKILDQFPSARTQVYDIRELIRTIVDTGSFFELKSRFGKSAVTGLARLDGRVVGIMANNPISKGGAVDTNGCQKMTSFLVLCDSFNIPIVTLVDTPGFIIGTAAERQGAPGKIMNMMNALALVTVPKISVIIRKSYGQAYLNMGGGRNSDEVLAWPTAEVSFMSPQFAATVVHGLDPGQPGFDEALAAMSDSTEVWDLASVYAVQSVVRPEDTREHLIRTLEIHSLRLTNGVGRHLMASWPTSF